MRVAIAVLFLTLPLVSQEVERAPASRRTRPDSRPSPEARTAEDRAGERTRKQLQQIKDVARLSKPEPKPDPKSKDYARKFLRWSDREKSRERRLQGVMQSIFDRNSEIDLAPGQKRRIICACVNGFSAFQQATAYCQLLDADDENGSQDHAAKHASPREAAKEFVVIEIYDVGIAKVRFLDETAPVYAHVVELRGWGAVF